MDQNIEDILSGDNPNRDLEKVPRGKNKNMGYRIINTLKKVKDQPMNTSYREQLWGRIEYSINQSAVPRRSILIPLLRWSAVACFFLTTSYFLWHTSFRHPDESPLVNAALSNKYIFSEDEEISLHSSNQRISIDDTQNTINVPSLKENPDQEDTGAFMTLTVPYGKRIEVVLPDNSTVWVNAGSQLTFPKKFDEGRREVYLEGEAFFDILHNETSPFFVQTADMLIKVLGTSFNVSSYQDDSFSSAVLLSGKIELQGTVKNPFESRVLEPGNAAILNKESKHLFIRKENAEDHMSWTRKQLILKNDPLPEILVRLERVYNTKISVDGDALKEDDTFSGRLDLSQPLTNLLINLYNPNEYTIHEEERRLTIKRR